MTKELIEQLRQISLFTRLKTRDLKRLAALFEHVEYNQGDFLTRQGEIGDSFYLLVSGQATVWHMDSDGAEQAVRVLNPEDHFGITSLFLDEARDATVRIDQNSTILSLERSLFNDLLDDLPAIRDDLTLPEALEERLRAPRFKWMTPDETTIFFATRTRWSLLAAEILPSLLFLTMMVIATVTRQWSYLPTIMALLAVIIGGGWALLRWQDWRNDYYVVTNKRVVHHESRLPTMQVTVDQAPLYQIQNINMLKPSLIARWLNFGTLDIQTAGKSGAITFYHLDEPEHCQQIIFGLLEKERSLTKISERAAIREAISQQMQPQEETLIKADSPAEIVPSTLSTFGEAVWDLGEDDTPSTEPSQAPDILGTIGERLYAFLPHFREERGGIITWHKHPFVLVKAVWLPCLILTGSLLVGIAGAMAQWELYDSMVLILFIFWCLTFFWLLWRYEDWRNDIFQMTNIHIIDIDRLPLGFRESRRQASLEQIQNINVDIPNFWARIFNYGNVMIETAGVTGDLTFEWVMRPRAVQAEIFERVEALRTKKRTEEIEQRRAEMAEWFSVYNQMKDQGEI